MIADSSDIAFAYVRFNAAKFGIDEAAIDSNDFQIAFEPAGKIDGPSAGITMATALISRLTGRKVKAGIAMTGEITMTGRVLKIGGLAQKVMAAHRMGYKMVIFPAGNIKDVAEIPEEIRKSVVLKPVKTYDEVLDLALEKKGSAPPTPSHVAPAVATSVAAPAVPIPAAAPAAPKPARSFWKPWTWLR